MEEIKILELFGGIGALTKAFKRQGIPHKVVDYVEIDKYAVASYNAINGTNFEPQDICQWDKDIEVDLIMHGSPCQDFSLAGKQAGGDEGSGTRSSLMYETIRIVEKLKPKYVIWENVKNLLSKKHRHNFDAYLETMSSLGYTNYYQVLNAKDYGIPQNRERVFTISIRDDSDFKDIDGNPDAGYDDYFAYNFKFPTKQELKLKLKDMLEDEVDEKYYLSDNMLQNYSRNFGGKGKLQNQESYCDTLQAAMGNGGGNIPIVNRKYGVFDTDKSRHQAGSIYDENELSTTLDTTQGGWRQPCIEIKSKCKRLKSLVEKTDFEEGKVLNMDLYNQTTNENISQCLTEPHHNSQRIFDGLRIRKLTPKECWRLMGFDDEDYEEASQFNSNTQLYKQAGNSIVVNVLEAIITNLLLTELNENKWLDLD